MGRASVSSASPTKVLEQVTVHLKAINPCHHRDPAKGQGSPRAGSPSDRGAFGGNSFRWHRSNHSRDSSGPRLSDRKNNRDALEPPLRDETLIKETYHDVIIPAHTAEDPKVSLTEFASQVPGTTLSFKYQVGMLNKQRLWRLVYLVFRMSFDVMILVADTFGNRSTVTLESDLTIVGEGDSSTKEDSEELAVLSVIYQLVQCGLVGTLTVRL